MAERLYPKPAKPGPNLDHRWLNEYNLVYDGGSSYWMKSYRTKIGSSIAAFYHEHIGSWGGSITRTDQEVEGY